MWPDLPPGLATFIPRTPRVFPAIDENVPPFSRRCWNCRTALRTDEPCMICSAPFEAHELALELPMLPRYRHPVIDPFAERVLPGLHERLARPATKVHPIVRAAQDPRIVRLAGALLLAVLSTVFWCTYQIERNACLGTLDTLSAVHAKQLRLRSRTTTAVPRVAKLGVAPVAIQESWIAPVGRREYDGFLSDRIRVVPTRQYRQYLRLAVGDPSLVKRVTQERGVVGQPLEHLGDGLYAIDLRDAHPRPTYYRIEGEGISARVRVH